MGKCDYIRLPRSELAAELSRNDSFGRLVWYLLSKVDADGTATFTSAEIELRFDISRQRLRTMIRKLLKHGFLTSSQPTSNQQATKVAFDFQCFNPPGQPTANQQATNSQPTKPPKRQRKTTTFIPPTDDEVAAYVAEKGYHFNPESFAPHYQSKGWKVGDQPMKDWRAACRTWETRWKEKYGERFYYELQPSGQPDNATTRKAQRDRGLSLATEIVANSGNLLNLFNGSGQPHPDSRPNQE